MIPKAQHILRSCDRLLPAILFAFLLSLQSIISTGAANGIAFPELVGPDGRVLTFADICNAASDDAGQQNHCASCVSHCAPAPQSIFTTKYSNFSAALPKPKTLSIAARPEASQALWRGPPAS